MPDGKRPLSTCPRCKSWSHNPCDFCGYERVGCNRCEDQTSGVCPYCRRECTPRQLELVLAWE
jgi:hypothetical protein